MEKNKLENTNIGNVGGDVHVGDVNINDTQKLPKHLTTKPFQAQVFLGRKNELEELHKKLFDDNKHILLVNGEGGIGKTSLVAKYYHTFEKDYHHVAWVSAEPSISEGLLSLISPLKVEDIKPKDETPEQLKKLFQKITNLPKPCLLVLDNVDNEEDLDDNYDYLEPCKNLHILLTTRLNKFLDLPFYTIKPLSQDNALELFKKHFPKHQKEDDILFENIYQAIEGNTLVIEVLAKSLKHLNQLKETYTFKDLYNDLTNKGLLRGGREETVRTAWQRRTKLKEAKPKEVLLALYDLSDVQENEVPLLSIFALLPPKDILFETLEKLLDNDKLQKTLLSLFAKGWLSYQEAQQSFRISPVIQEIVREQNQERLEEDCEELLENLSELLDETDEEGNSKDIEDIQEIIKIYYPLAKAVLANFGKAINTLNGTAYNLLEDIMYFEKNIRRVKSDPHLSYESLKAYIHQEEQGTAQTDLLEAYIAFVNICYKALNYEEAIQYQDIIIQIYKEKYPDTKVLADALDFGGKMCQEYGGKYLNQGLTYYREEGKILEKLQSDEITMALWQNDIATVLRRLGGASNLLDAKGLLEKSLHIYSKKFHQNRTKIASIQSNLATVLQDLGGETNLLEARGLLEKALASDIANFGEIHPNVARVQSNLATVLQDLGGKTHLLEAKGLLEKALASNIANFGENHSTVAISQSNLAIVLKGLGGESNLLEAKGLLEKALEGSIKNFGETHPKVATSQSNLALVLQDLGGASNLLEAKGLLEKALESDIANFGEYHPEVAKKQSNLAMVLKDLGGASNLLEAKKLLQHALVIMNIHFPEGHPHTDILLDNLWGLFMETTKKKYPTFSQEEYEKYQGDFELWLNAGI